MHWGFYKNRTLTKNVNAVCMEAVGWMRLVRILQVSRGLNVVSMLMFFLQLGSGERERDTGMDGSQGI